MTEQPKAIFLCPICGDHVPAFNADEISIPPGTPMPSFASEEEFIAWAAQAKLEALVKANEAVVLHHVQIRHTIADVLQALGTARNALMDIRAAWDDPSTSESDVWDWMSENLDQAIERGLGGK